MKHPPVNAFTINRVGSLGPSGIASSFFPFSFRVSRKEDIVSIDAYPLRVVDLCELFQRRILEYLAVFDVGSAEFHEPPGASQSLQGLATTSGIAFMPIDSESIVLPKEELPRLLSAFNHYDLCLFDLSDHWDEIEVIGQILTSREHNWQSQESILSKLPSSRLFLSSHDDCYDTLETYKEGVAEEIFALMLSTYTQAVLAEEHRFTSEIPEVPLDLVERFGKEKVDVTILRDATEIRGDRLEIGVSQKAYSFRETKDYSPEFWIVYDLKNERWLLKT